MNTVKLAAQAMATRFELVLHGEDEVYLRAAGEEAVAEIRRLEAQLSFYRASSQISRINAEAAERSVRVEPKLFQLLRRAKQLYEATEGTFDPTIAPLMRCWGFTGEGGRIPDPEALAQARDRTGMHLVNLYDSDQTVRFSQPGVLLDLGSIGKGYAIEEAAIILREAGVTSALIHGGTSTVYGLGRPAEGERWKVAVSGPGQEGAPYVRQGQPVVFALEDQALSVSAVWGKSFVIGDEEYGHVLDPRTGCPVRGAVLAAVAAPSATDTDALSTAALVLGADAPSILERYAGQPRGFVLTADADEIAFGGSAPSRANAAGRHAALLKSTI